MASHPPAADDPSGATPRKRRRIGSPGDDGAGTPHEDAPLVRRAASGDREAFQALVEKHQGLVFAIALRRSRSRDDAEDIAQDALMHLWRSLPNLRDPNAFVGWLIALVQNRAYRFIKQRNRKVVVLKEARTALETRARERSNDTPPDESHLLLAKLPEEMRWALSWKYINGCSYAEIGSRLGLTFHQVDYLLRRARRTLKEAVENDRNSEGRARG